MNRSRFSLVRLLQAVLLGVVIGCIIAPDPVFARAGGGGGYGGGGGGGFSGGGGFGGGGSFGRGIGSGGAALPPWAFGLILGAMVVWAIFGPKDSNADDGGFRLDRSLDLGESGVDQNHHESAVAAIRGADPAFDADKFSARFQNAFLQIQNAWQKQDMRPVQHFVSDGVFERFALQIQEQQDLGYRDQMDEIRVSRVLLAEFAPGSPFDVLTVRVRASAIDFRVSMKTGKYLSGSQSPEGFVEFWSFVRRDGVRTDPEKAGLIEGCCPNCNDSIRLNQVVKCSSCGAILRSGEYDWVLSEITQACEWRPRSRDEAVQLRRYQQAQDPGFNLQHLEDRASVVFWRKAMADRLGSVRPLRKMAFESLCRRYAEKYDLESRAGERKYSGGCSVGSVGFRGVFSKEDFDYAVIEIRWAANKHATNRQDRVRDLGNWRRLRSLYLLARRQGVQTTLSRSIDSAHCPACGAPESDLESHGCDACGTVLNTGEHDWVLVDCDFIHSPSAEGWLAKLSASVCDASREPGSREGDDSVLCDADLLAWMISVVAADGRIEERERAAILRLAQKCGVPEAMMDGIIAAALCGELDVPAPPNDSVARAWLEQMGDVALADDAVEPSEMEVLKRLGRHAGWAPVDIRLMLNKRRAKRVRAEREN